ncbi:hypothetical protein KHA80_00105 [Anaerobacillus sp. HL2]|nr:hypothetical protein KHA80_00105 [Anaerobacillus sp. HL2]
MKKTVKAGVIAGIGLAFVYISVGLLGVSMASYGV